VVCAGEAVLVGCLAYGVFSLDAVEPVLA
jgi:hypothetical protein